MAEFEQRGWFNWKWNFPMDLSKGDQPNKTIQQGEPVPTEFAEHLETEQINPTSPPFKDRQNSNLFNSGSVQKEGVKFVLVTDQNREEPNELYNLDNLYTITDTHHIPAVDSTIPTPDTR